MKKSFQKIISWHTAKFLLAIGLVLFVIQKTDFNHILLLKEQISWSWLALRGILFLLLLFMKAFQYYIIIGNIPYKSVLDVVVWQNSISNFISNSAGIASYMTMLKAEKNVKLIRSGLTFLIVKFGDLVAICLYLIFSTIVVWNHIQPLQWITILLIAVMLLGLGTFLITVIWREKFVTLLTRIFAWFKLDRFSLVKRSIEMLDSLAEEEQDSIFSMLRIGALTSFVYMTLTMAYAYTNVGIFNLPISAWEAIYASSLEQMVSFVPIQVLGGLGVTDLTIVYLYGVFGIDQAEMSAVALGIRALFYLMNAAILLYIPINALLQKKNADKDISCGS